MGKWKLFFMTLLFIGIAPLLIHAEENDEEQPPTEEQQTEQPKRKGLVSGLVTTVTDTVSSVGDVVKETVETTGNTVKQTVEFTEKTVNTVANPPSERPVKQVVEQTAEFVQETVENTKPVVNQTSETLRETIGNVTELTEELPVVSHANPVVEETVNHAADTVERTNSLVNETVTTVTTPADKPIKQVVENTADFIGETVGNTVPVVEKTTGMVQGVVQDVTEVTKAVPDLPVVTPILDGTSDVVNKTVGAVTDTADQTVSGTSDIVVETIGTLKPTEPAEPELDKELVLSPGEVVVPEQQNEGFKAIPLNKPNIISKNEASSSVSQTAESNDANTIEESLTILEKVPNSKQFMVQQESALVEQNSSSRVDLLEKDARNSMDLNESGLTNETQTVSGSPAVFMTTSSSITTSSSAPSSSQLNVNVDVLSEHLLNVQLISNRWYMENSVGKLQWVHAPPGQPPQTAPFLYVSI